MSKNQHNPDQDDQALNQNNQMSDDPGDGSRTSFVLGKDGNTPADPEATNGNGSKPPLPTPVQ